MERNSAACVMEWSIELEKALRSPKPGRSLEAISEIGPKLVRLSTEPECSPVIYHMFDLIPAEEKLFSNAIVLRLARAFESGDQHTRLCILKAFLYEYRKRNKRKEYRGVLSKTEAHVRVELLGRVKVVFDSGDVEDRALALGLFGCWAHFAKESPSIRYLVLSSMVSPHILEVKASLFAAGCFAELSEDFARVVLEMLLHMLNSPETLPGIRLAGVRMFAKVGFSHSIANNAYKVYRCEVVIRVVGQGLSGCHAGFPFQTCFQADLLVLFLNKEKTYHLRGTALRCLHYIFRKGMYHVPLNTSLVNTLFSMLDEPQLPSPMLFQALQTLRKIILRIHPNQPFDVFESSKLVSIATNVSASPITSESMLAISVLVDISRKLKGSTQMESFVHSESLLPSRVILLIIDQITLTMKPVLALCEIDSVVLPRVNFLLDLLIILNREYPDLHLLVLDQIFGLIKSISIVHDNVMATTDTDAFVHDNADLKERSVIRSKLVFRIYRFLITFLENLSEAEAISTKVFDKVKILVEHLCQSNLFECHAYTIYSLLLQHQFIWGHLVHESEGSCNRLSGISLHNYSVEHETHVIDFAKRMLTEKNSWPAYRVGTYAACQGAWHTANFIFEQLVKRVRSDLCCRWLKSLVHYAHGEWKYELLRLPKQGLETHKFPLTLSIDDLGEIGQDSAYNMKGHIYSKELTAAYNSLCSSLETLRVDVTTGQSFYFQRWFLSLRAKLLGAVVDILNILGNIIKNRQGQKSSMVKYFISLQRLIQISLQLKRVAQEFDLVTTSFIDIDKKSSSIISALAMSCSLLAFCSGFALYIPSLVNGVAICGPGVANNIDTILIQNLVGRLWHSNHETITDLCLLWEAGGKPFDCFHFRSRIQACENCSEARDILGVSSDAVSGFSGLKSKYNIVQNEEGLSEVTKDGLQLLLEILMKWMQIPFQTPKYFFNLRPCLGSELFAVNETRNPDGICVSLGFHLSLNLCLQLRNVTPDIPVRFNKFYCMLYCGLSFLEPRASGQHKEQELGTCQAWETDDMVEMNEKLLKYATECSTKKSNKRGRSSDDEDLVYSFVCFELNDRGQGFSSCLLDVSGFPAGYYRIKWYSCCFDNQGECWTLPPLNPGPVFTVHSL
ncbi:putative integrator complex subunit 7 [Rosa chinensis]|uniref:Putative integrator complex subunit 7 n=1 Tax=Rosa chinensis TaxID=74649 RepID=A0A2P6QRM7_ROSCH|nr:putative integrator complex subunit 7 [Rosa chinensis]